MRLSPRSRPSAAAPELRAPRIRQHLEGALRKYTNLLHGWQRRFFVLEPDSGLLWYYLSDACRSQQNPRGALSLIGARVCSSADHPYMFTVQSMEGQLYKLRAEDAQEQEIWMTQLQLCSRQRSSCGTKVVSPAEPQKPLQTSVEPQPRRGPLSADEEPRFKMPSSLSCLGRCLSLFHQNIQRSQLQNQAQSPDYQIDQALSLVQPRPRATLNHLDSEGLVQANHCPAHRCSEGPDGSVPSDKPLKKSTAPPVCSSRTSREPAHRSELVTDGLNVSEEFTDTEDNTEEELGVFDEQRSVLIHLLSQLKLGMDLTRVVLPTFILERRSLLEMYANFMAHPDMFLSISGGSSAEERIIRFVEYYLTAFHEGRKGAVAKKPYNPILGETFLCSWDVPRDEVRPLHQTLGPTRTTTGTTTGATGCRDDSYRLRFVAEQVSHHPPVSGFYCECPEKGMCVNAHVWTKSKFMGVSVGVSMVGEGVLYLLEHGEQYTFTLPCAYARSVLTVPWVELGGKVSICCPQTGYSASVTFQTKPFYGGKVHRVTAEVRHNHTGAVVCRAQGEWNGVLEFSYSSGDTKTIDTNRLSVTRKRLRPLDCQGPSESRRLWQHVTEALKTGNMDEATEHKRHLEERQRSDERQRATTKTPWTPKYFHRQGEGWVYNRPLWETH